MMLTKILAVACGLQLVVIVLLAMCCRLLSVQIAILEKGPKPW